MKNSLVKCVCFPAIFFLCVFLQTTTVSASVNTPLDSVKVWAETGGLGHVWISVGSGDQLVVYSYGNYAAPPEKSSGAAGLFPGRGVMLRMEGEQAFSYIQQKLHKSGASEYWVEDVKGQDVRHYCDSVFYQNTAIPSTGKYADKQYARFVLTYRLARHNCTTFAVNALTNAHSKIFCNKKGKLVSRKIFTPRWADSFLQKRTVKTDNTVRLLAVYAGK